VGKYLTIINDLRLKDLGKKWFAFSLIEEDVFELKKRVSEVLDAK